MELLGAFGLGPYQYSRQEGGSQTMALRPNHRGSPLLTQKGPYTAHLRTLVPKAIPGMVSGTRVLKWAVLEGSSKA